jgi:hypothetical protein
VKWVWNIMEENEFESWNKRLYYIIWNLKRVRIINFEIQNSNKKMWYVENDPIIIIVVWNVMLNKVKKDHGG